jgi:hypothetical protein
MMKTVFALPFDVQVVENFLFMEHDYIVAPTVHSTIVQGLNAMKQFKKRDIWRLLSLELVYIQPS